MVGYDPLWDKVDESFDEVIEELESIFDGHLFDKNFT